MNGPKEADEQTKPATADDILGDLDGLDWQLPDMEPPTAATGSASADAPAEPLKENTPSPFAPKHPRLQPISKIN
ncbi:MAG: hypothetical protein R3F37_21875 [Candidatus Competibacteraceae bacterium]